MTTIAYFRIYWRFVEPEMGKYNWDMLDKAVNNGSGTRPNTDASHRPYGTTGKGRRCAGLVSRTRRR